VERTSGATFAPHTGHAIGGGAETSGFSPGGFRQVRITHWGPERWGQAAELSQP
jgi:hypothetical protein